jgi:hypothetical protein
VSNNSQAPGYLSPGVTTALPRQFTLDQFLQGILVGLSELSGSFVRPKFQQQPPLNPDINVNWISFGVSRSVPDSFAFTGFDSENNYQYQMQETLEVAVGFHGPNALDTAYLVRDGFQIPQNLQALEAGLMGYTGVSSALRVPELVNERWFDRYEMTIFLRRETQRTYPVVNILSANGTIYSLGSGEFTLNWQAGD